MILITPLNVLMIILQEYTTVNNILEESSAYLILVFNML
jgi:hypothetical protein